MRAIFLIFFLLFGAFAQTEAKTEAKTGAKLENISKQPQVIAQKAAQAQKAAVAKAAAAKEAAAKEAQKAAQLLERLKNPPNPEQDIDNLDLAAVSLTRLLGQMLMISFKGHNANEAEVKEASQLASLGKIGAVLFLEQNVKDKAQFKALVGRFMGIAVSNPLFLGISQSEDSPLNHEKGFLAYPKAQAVAKGNLRDAFNTYLELATTLKELGLNLNLAPKTSWHKNASKCSIYAQEFAAAMHKKQLVLIANDLCSQAAMNDLLDTEALNGVQLDKLAQSSTAALKLRKEREFSGLVFSEDLLYAAPNLEPSERAVAAIEAGADVLYFSSPGSLNIFDTVLSAVEEAISSGRIDRSRIEGSYKRVLKAKIALKRSS